MKQRMLVDLDSLLDTRLATIAHIDPQLAVDAAGTHYRDRQSDDFDALLGVSVNERYNEAYRNRDIETLKAARCTAAVVVLHEITNQWEDEARRTPYVEETGVDVNIYPYDLNEDQKEAMITAVMAYSGIYANIEIVSHPPERLTPAFIDQHWTVLMMYDFNEWLTHHVENLKNNKIPSMTIVAPALYHNKEPEMDEVPKIENQPLNPFACLEMVLAEFVSLNLLETKYFSIIET